MAYPTASDIISYCGITDTDHATMAGDMLNWAIQIIESTTGRVFDAASSDAATRYFHSEYDVDGQTLYLDQDLMSVSIDTDGKLDIDVGDGGTIALATSDVTYLPPNDTPKYAIKIKGVSGYTWTWVDESANAIAVKGLWGYSSTPPNDIVYCVNRLCKWIYNQRLTSSELDRPLLTESGSVIMPMKLPADVLSILSMYKRIKLGAPCQ